MLGSASRVIRLMALSVLALFSMGIVAAQPEPATLTITHAQGETEVVQNPSTVLTFDLASLSTLHVLGVPVAGVPAFNMPDSLAEYASDDYLKIGSLFEPDYETVNAAEADLIIVAARSASVYPQLSEIAPTIDLTADWANFLESNYANAQVLGQIFDKSEEVEALWETIFETVEEVKAKTAEAGTALIVMVSGGQITAYGTGSRFGWIHDELGFTPVIEDIQQATHGEAISFEFILEANPDWLIVIDRDLAIGQEGEAAKNILDNELIAQTTAWANDQVIYLNPSNWYVVMGGTGAIQEMVDEINAALPALETDATPDATPEAEATSQG